LYVLLVVNIFLAPAGKAKPLQGKYWVHNPDWQVPEQHSLLAEHPCIEPLQVQAPPTQVPTQHSLAKEQDDPLALHPPPPPPVLAHAPPLQELVQHSEFAAQVAPTALQLVGQVVRQSSPKQSSGVLILPFTTSSFSDGAVVPTPTLPEMFKSPALVCAVEPVLIGAAMFPPGGVSAGSVQAMTAAPMTTETASALATSAIFFAMFFILLFKFSPLNYYTPLPKPKPSSC
jgi:hypothetical protein